MEDRDLSAAPAESDAPETPAPPSIDDPATPENSPEAEIAVPDTLPVPGPADGAGEPATFEATPENPPEIEAAVPDTLPVPGPADGNAETAKAEAAPAAAENPPDVETAAPDATDTAPEVAMEDLLPAEPEPEAVSLEDAQLRAVVEAIVYVAEEPLTLAQLSAALHQPPDRVRSILDQIVVEFDRPEHGVTVREVAGGFKMATKPEHHEAVRAFVKSLKPPLKLSLPALETLAVIAYKQPVTAPEIQEIRGVQGAGVLKTLLDRKLIAVAGRKNVIGKPMLYKTTKEFLIQFGLKDLTELPSLKEFEEIRRMAFTDEPAQGAPNEAISETQTEAAQDVSPTSDEPVSEPETQQP